jgi:hypothetical protein
VAFDEKRSVRPAKLHNYTLRAKEGFIHADRQRPEECMMIISNHAMATQCALELFSGFVEALADLIDEVGGTTEDEMGIKRADSHTDSENVTLPLGTVNVMKSEVQHDGSLQVDEHKASLSPTTSNPEAPSSHFNGPRWTNSVLQSISQTLVDYGIVDSIEEANGVVIPPFARRNLLPPRAGHIIFEEQESTEEEPLTTVPTNPSDNDSHRKRRRLSRASVKNARKLRNSLKL